MNTISSDTGATVAKAAEYLAFTLGQEEYGIDIQKVSEIRSYETPTRIANAPEFVKGVVNLRGFIVPILDLRLKFGLSEAHCDGSAVVIVLNVMGRVLGIVVDEVSEVIEFKADDLRPSPAFNGAIDVSHILGLGAIRQGDRERLLILTDIERLMASPEMGLVDAQALLN